MSRNAMIVLGMLLTTAGNAHAKGLVSPPVYVTGVESYLCMVSNVGTKPLSDVVVTVVVDGGGILSSQTCATVPPGGVCTESGSGGPTSAKFCTATGVSKGNSRGSFCNSSTNVCLPLN